jgi:osmotically-inducible protein OsmY
MNSAAHMNHNRSNETESYKTGTFSERPRHLRLQARQLSLRLLALPFLSSSMILTLGCTSNQSRLSPTLLRVVEEVGHADADSSNVRIIQDEDTFTLEGSVGSSEDRTKLQQIAKSNPGVVKVINSLRVDEKLNLAKRVRNRIKSDAQLNPYHIAVSNHGSGLYLAGVVRAQADITRMLSLVESESPGISVENTVVAMEDSTATIEEDVSSAMESLPRAATESVMYCITDEVVTLTGRVTKQEYLQQLVATILSVPGVRGVRSNIELVRTED